MMVHKTTASWISQVPVHSSYPHPRHSETRHIYTTWRSRTGQTWEVEIPESPTNTVPDLVKDSVKSFAKNCWEGSIVTILLDMQRGQRNLFEMMSCPFPFWCLNVLRVSTLNYLKPVFMSLLTTRAATFISILEFSWNTKLLEYLCEYSVLFNFYFIFTCPKYW